MMPKLLERAAPAKGAGSVTGLYTVLVEGDDITDPVGDASRGLLDGHIILSRDLANRGHYPAVDVLQSLSRLTPEISTKADIEAARTVREWMAVMEDSKDLVSVGAYKPGADKLLDSALSKKKNIQAFLHQGMEDYVEFEETQRRLTRLLQGG